MNYSSTPIVTAPSRANSRELVEKYGFDAIFPPGHALREQAIETLSHLKRFLGSIMPFFLLGLPGTGKGYSWLRLGFLKLHEHDAALICCKDSILRYSEHTTPLGEALKLNMQTTYDKCQLVDDAPVILVIMLELLHHAQQGIIYLGIDGYPRSLRQLGFLLASGFNCGNVIHLDTTFELALRAVARRFTKAKKPRHEDHPENAPGRVKDSMASVKSVADLAGLHNLLTHIPTGVEHLEKVRAVLAGFPFQIELLTRLDDELVQRWPEINAEAALAE